MKCCSQLAPAPPLEKTELGIWLCTQHPMLTSLQRVWHAPLVHVCAHRLERRSRQCSAQHMQPLPHQVQAGQQRCWLQVPAGVGQGCDLCGGKTLL